MSIMEIQNNYSMFLQKLDQVCNGISFIGSFDLDLQQSLEVNISAYLLNGLFTQQLFKQDEINKRFNYADFDCDAGDFVYPEIKNYFVKEPLQISYQQVEVGNIINKYVNFFVSPKSPYQKQLSEREAVKIVDDFILSITGNCDSGDPQFYEIEPNFLYSRKDIPKNSIFIPYFDNWYFDSSLLIQFKDTAFLLLSNGLP